ncbi:LexA family protein [Methylobacterium brachiatum]
MTDAVAYGLTAQQGRALTFLRNYANQHGRPPTFGEIAAACGLRSKSGAHRLIEALEERGHIRRLHDRARSIVLTSPDPAASTVTLPRNLYIRATADACRLGMSLDRYIAEMLEACLPDAAASSAPERFVGRPWAS